MFDNHINKSKYTIYFNKSIQICLLVQATMQIYRSSEMTRVLLIFSITHESTLKTIFPSSNVNQ